MKSSFFRWLLLLGLILFLPGTAAAQGKFGEEAPDFPPGVFSDGLKYRLSDFKGKVVVLFFYESTCPRCKGTIPARNAVVKAFKDRPVMFIAIGASDPWYDVARYSRETGLAMPIFVDSLGLMEKRYGQKISLQNIWQFRVIGPDGRIVGYEMTRAALEKVLDEVKVEWKYNRKDYDPKLEPALAAFEWNQHVVGMKLLAPLRKSKTKAVAKSAAQLYAEIRKEGEAWKEEAEKVAEENPLQAYDLYGRVAKVFAGEDLAKSVAAPMKKLAADKAVSRELAARKAFDQLQMQMAQVTSAQSRQIIAVGKAILKKFAGTPTAEQVQTLITELGG
jgi:peroxiredoxin